MFHKNLGNNGGRTHQLKVKMSFKFRTICSIGMLSFAALTSMIITSCKETKDSVSFAGKASVSIHLLGVENPVTITSKSNKSIHTSTSDKPIRVPLTASSAIEATLSPVPLTRYGSPLRASAAPRAAATEERSPLGENVKYKIVVYNDAGKYVTEKIYTNQVDNDQEIALDAGHTYTFVAFSINSTTTVPTITAPDDLNTAKLADISADLMYFKQQLPVQSGDNTIDVILRHQYSEVTTNLSMDTEMTGAITQLGTTTIGPTYPSANLQLADGSITYNGSTSTSNVVFPALGPGLRTVSSVPSLLIHPVETNGVFNFGSITIDGETKNNVSFTGLRIAPGERYNLNLTFKTCTEEVTGGANLNWNYLASGGGANVNGTIVPNGSIVEQTLTAPGADYGFVFDILEMDNSFNMEVNGIPLATQEIQFEANIAIAPKNVAFEDGSLHGGINTAGGTIPQIYAMVGTATNPLIRVVISREGKVSMYGSKSSGGELYPLVLTAGSFNTVPWNPASNTVKITQVVQGKTSMVGAGSGRKKVTCS